jgi:hypothetical protein
MSDYNAISPNKNGNIQRVLINCPQTYQGFAKFVFSTLDKIIYGINR